MITRRSAFRRDNPASKNDVAAEAAPTINRRELLLGGAALVTTSALAGCGRAEVARPEGVPLGPFGADSTAEEVTAGMDLSGTTALVTIGIASARRAQALALQTS